jgi:hypothetical protein
MCVGRGAYDVSNISDGTTPVTQIDGMSVEVYAPNTSPLSGDAAQTTVGDAISADPFVVIPSKSTNGQTLVAPNAREYFDDNNIQCVNNGTDCYIQNTIDIDFSQTFVAGDSIAVSGASYSDLSGSVDLDGTYTIASISTDTIYLVNAPSVNSDWTTINGWSGHTTSNTPTTSGVTITVVEDTWVGPFIIPSCSQIWVNIVAGNGLYKINDKNRQSNTSVDVDIEVTPVDSTGTPTGGAQTFSETLTGTAQTRSSCGFTFKLSPTAGTSAYSVRVQRTSDFDYSFTGQIIDEIKWRDLYAVRAMGVTDFGNVTTVYARVPATPTALAIKERKLNMLATRKVYILASDGTLGGTLTASKDVGDILCFAALDPYIGKRSSTELDGAQIYAEIAAVSTYFGTSEAKEFGYTFDDDTMSFEETATIIANAAFCDAIRRGSLIQLVFEKATTDSVILFNHRNKMPGTENRPASFGKVNENDGVEFSYVDKDNYDAPLVYRIPTDGSAERPKKLDGTGMRNYSQVYWRAWREWNKIQHQHFGTEFTALEDAAIVSRVDRVLVADNTRPYTQDGYVRSQTGLTLNLSQPVTFASGKTYTIFLQLPDGSVDAISITAGSTSRDVVLGTAPSSALSLDSANSVRCGYWIVADDDGREQAFLVTSKEADGPKQYKITAIAYDARFYTNDTVTPV